MYRLTHRRLFCIRFRAISRLGRDVQRAAGALTSSTGLTSRCCSVIGNSPVRLLNHSRLEPALSSRAYRPYAPITNNHLVVQPLPFPALSLILSSSVLPVSSVFTSTFLPRSNCPTVSCSSGLSSVPCCLRLSLRQLIWPPSASRWR